MLRVSTSIIAGLACAALALTGCGGQETADDAAERTIEQEAARQGSQVDVDIDTDAETMAIEGTNEDGEQFSMNISGAGDGEFTFESGSQQVVAGGRVELPAGFPEDVPVAPGTQLQMASADAGEGTFAVTGMTTDSLTEAAAFYDAQAQANGWTLATNVDTGDQMKIRNYEKDGRTFGVVLVNQEERTSVQLTVTAADE